MLQPFCGSFSCNSMNRSGSSAFHGMNPNFKKLKKALTEIQFTSGNLKEWKK